MKLKVPEEEGIEIWLIDVSRATREHLSSTRTQFWKGAICPQLLAGAARLSAWGKRHLCKKDMQTVWIYCVTKWCSTWTVGGWPVAGSSTPQTDTTSVQKSDGNMPLMVWVWWGLLSLCSWGVLPRSLTKSVVWLCTLLYLQRYKSISKHNL